VTLYINISQGRVATYLSCGGIFSCHFTANLLLNLTVKEFSKSVKIWHSYHQEFGDLRLTFLEQSVVAIIVNWSQDWTKAACLVLDHGAYNVQWINCDWSILLTTQRTGHWPNNNNIINNIWPLWLRKLPDISRSCVVTFLSVVASLMITYLRTYCWVPRWKGPMWAPGSNAPLINLSILALFVFWVLGRASLKWPIM